MLVAIRIPEFLPDLAYFDSLYKADVCIMLDTLLDKKKSNINRTHIIRQNRKEYVEVPVNKSRKQGGVLRDIEPIDIIFWQKKFLKQIHHSYKSASYFEESFFDIKDCVEQSWKSVTDLNCAFIILISLLLQITCRLQRTSELHNSVCNEMQLDEMIQAAGGTSLVLEEHGSMPFTEYFTTPKFLPIVSYRYSSPPGREHFYPFIPGISILDPLFNLGRFGTFLQLQSTAECALME